jgi:hypothetical protein
MTERDEIDAAARTLGLEVISLPIRRMEDVAAAFEGLKGRFILAPILFVGSGTHSRDHIGGRTRSRDLGDVPRRMIFQGEAGHEIRSARHLS